MDEIAAALSKVNERCDPPLEESEIRKIAKSIARYQPGDDALQVTVRSGSPPDQKLVNSGEVGILLSDVEPERVDWLWRGRIPNGKLAVLEVIPGWARAPRRWTSVPG